MDPPFSLFSNAVVYFILFLYFYFYTRLFLLLFFISQFLNNLIRLCEYLTKSARMLRDSRRTGFRDPVGPHQWFEQHCRILMKIDCFDKDNDIGNNNVDITGAAPEMRRFGSISRANVTDAVIPCHNAWMLVMKSRNQKRSSNNI